jgi:hypothetical protein
VLLLSLCHLLGRDTHSQIPLPCASCDATEFRTQSNAPAPTLIPHTERSSIDQ